jgi:hypothetical protein
VLTVKLKSHQVEYIEYQGQAIRVEFRLLSGEMWISTRGLLAEIAVAAEAEEADVKSVPVDDKLTLWKRSMESQGIGVAACVRRLDSAPWPEDGSEPDPASFSPVEFEIEGADVFWNSASQEQRRAALADYEDLRSKLHYLIIPGESEARLLGKSARRASMETKESSPPASGTSSSTPASSP